MKSATEVAADVRNRHCSVREVVAAALARIEATNPSVNAFVFLDAEAALAQADAIDAALARGADPGPLAGVPFGVKDNDAVAGMPTRQGSLLLAEAGAEARDSVHVARLRAAGGIPIGKVACAEFGLDGVTHTLAHGTTRNPWNLGRTPSGSSGGSSAAVAAGMTPLATGSDGLGSIRCPAGFTGLVGLKPSLGRIPRADGFRDTSSPGALTATVTDTARYLDVVSGPSDRDRMSLPPPSVRYEQIIESLDVAGLKAGFSADLGFAPVTDEVRALCEAAAGDLASAAGLDLRPDRFTCVNTYVAWNALAARTLHSQFQAAGWLPDHADRISPGPRTFIERHGAMSIREELAYQDMLKTLERQVAVFFEEHDVLITPTACCEAYAAEGPLPEVIEGRDASQTNAEPYTTIGSICWNPSISVPAGLSRSGLPIGLMLTGPRHRDELVLRLARIWEQARPWPRTAPGWDNDLSR
jgi:aspartyl-tRNA(Asn)/glutamyl-tRNA(Gln) amidotransferase subunit A